MVSVENPERSGFKQVVKKSAARRIWWERQIAISSLINKWLISCLLRTVSFYGVTKLFYLHHCTRWQLALHTKVTKAWSGLNNYYDHGFGSFPSLEQKLQSCIDGCILCQGTVNTTQEPVKSTALLAITRGEFGNRSLWADAMR
jgi:hypothetical protein